MNNGKKRKPGEVFLDLDGSIVVKFDGFKMRNVDNGEVIILKGMSKVITGIEQADGNIRTSPDHHVAYSNKAKCLTELATKLNAPLYYDLALLHYNLAISLSGEAEEFIQQATYFSRRANLLMKMDKLNEVLSDIEAANRIASREVPASPAEKTSVSYVKGNILNITKLQYVREKIEFLSKNGLISKETEDALLQGYRIFTDSVLAANANDHYRVKIAVLEERLGSVEERQAFHEYDINTLKDTGTNVTDLLEQVLAVIEDMKSGNGINVMQVKQYLDSLDKIPLMEKITDMVKGLLEASEEKIVAEIYVRAQEQILQLKGELSARIDGLEQRFAELRELNGRLGQSYRDIEQLKLQLKQDNGNEQIETRIRELEAGRQILEKKVGSIVGTLETTGIITQEKLIGDIAKLKTDNPQLHKYFTTLFFQLGGYFQVYQEMGTGLVGNGSGLEDQKEPKNDNIKFFSGIMARAGLSLVTSIVDNYSYGAMSAFEGIVNDVMAERSKVVVGNEVSRIQNVIKAKLLDNIGSLDKNKIAELAWKLTDIRKTQLGYDLVLMSDSMNVEEKLNIEKNKVYIALSEEQGGVFIKYTVLNPKGEETTDYINIDDIHGFNPQTPIRLDQLTQFKSSILEITLKRGHTHQLKGQSKDDKKEEGYLSKFDGLLGAVRDKMVGTAIERYTSTEEKLAAHDALMLLICISERYKKMASMNESLPEFFNEWMLRELEVRGQLQDTLKEVQEAAKEGHWQSTEHYIKGHKVSGHKNIEGRLSDELNEKGKTYLQDKLGALNSPENVEMAKMLYFAMINVGVKESRDHHNPVCVREFNKHEGLLVNKIANEHPEYFASNREAINICVEDPRLKTSVLEKMSNVIQINAVTELVYDNPVLNDPEALQQFVLEHGTKGLNDLIDLLGISSQELSDQL